VVLKTKEAFACVDKFLVAELERMNVITNRFERICAGINTYFQTVRTVQHSHLLFMVRQ